MKVPFVCSVNAVTLLPCILCVFYFIFSVHGVTIVMFPVGRLSFFKIIGYMLTSVCKTWNKCIQHTKLWPDLFLEDYHGSLCAKNNRVVAKLNHC